MKPVFAMILLLCAAPAMAEEASCTFTYNKYSRSIVKTCRGNLPVSTCVVKVTYDPATRKGEVLPADCK